jgi:site-specific recombinase XerD
MKNTNQFSVLLQSFFTDYLIAQRRVSQHTIASYRDTFRLFLRFSQKHLKKAPSNLSLNDIDASLIRLFLRELEAQRNVSAQTRNQRLAAIHSCFRYAALQYPEYSEMIQQILAIPHKRYNRVPIDYLTTDEVNNLLNAPDRTVWSGRRDYTLLLVDIRTGLRVSELTDLHKSDVTFGTGAHIHCFGKGRKERSTPITKNTAKVLQQWLRECKINEEDLIFTNARGGHLSTDGVQYILDKHIGHACELCPSLKKKRITPHVLRHTAAMQLLQSGVDPMIIAIWLGHESIETTQVYIKEDLKMKEQALQKTQESKSKSLRYKPEDKLLNFLQAL